MSDNSKQPDNAGTPDGFEDDLDVPTYSGQDEETRFLDRPEEPAQTPMADEPREPKEHTRGESVYGRAGRAQPQEIKPNDNETTSFAAPAGPASYADEDFAPQGEQRTEYLDFSQPEPAPAQDPAETTVAPAGAVGTVGDGAVVPDTAVDARRGTIDLGLFLFRFFVGLWLVIESLRTFFELGGSQGLAGLESEFATYAYPEILAVAVPALQLAAGVFLILGLMSPVAAMVALVVTGFTAIHSMAVSGAGLDIFAWPETLWLSVVLFGWSFALQFTGPGVYSADRGRSWARRPVASSWIFIVVGLAATGAAWWFGAGINPLV